MMKEGASSEELDMARANAEAAKAVYELARLQLDYAKVSSPVAGIVAKLFVDEGNMVGTSTALLTIVREDPIEACISIPEKHYAGFSGVPGSFEIRVFPVAYPEKPPFTGVVKAVAPIIDPASRTFEVCADIGNPKRLLKPGMYVNTEIVIGNEKDLLMVPDTAVVLRDGQPVVFKVVEGESMTAVGIAVETGKKSDGFTAVTGEIDENDSIIILGNAFLEDGQTVEVVEQR
jgi:RND family efflux transporter MFP subunit